MSGFSSDWLALREPADAKARSVRVFKAVQAAVEHHLVLRVLDLGSGTGANVRYLAERLGGDQAWLLVDLDEALLAAVPGRLRDWSAERGHAISVDAGGAVILGTEIACNVALHRADLRRIVEEPPIFEGRHLVTASALLDLVSRRWLDTLARRISEARAAALFVLNYDGRIACTPREPEDDEVEALVNRHQRGDKGFGAALGPDAATAVERAFARQGYRTATAASDWHLGPAARDMQAALIDGWAQAAAAIAPHRADDLAGWRARRLAHVDAGRSELRVGHLDVGAWPRRFHPETSLSGFETQPEASMSDAGA